MVKYKTTLIETVTNLQKSKGNSSRDLPRGRGGGSGQSENGSHILWVPSPRSAKGNQAQPHSQGSLPAGWKEEMHWGQG